MPAILGQLSDNILRSCLYLLTEYSPRVIFGDMTASEAATPDGCHPTAQTLALVLQDLSADVSV
jgi:hypothetical protein